MTNGEKENKVQDEKERLRRQSEKEKLSEVICFFFFVFSFQDLESRYFT